MKRYLLIIFTIIMSLLFLRNIAYCDWEDDFRKNEIMRETQKHILFFVALSSSIIVIVFILYLTYRFEKIRFIKKEYIESLRKLKHNPNNKYLLEKAMESGKMYYTSRFKHKKDEETLTISDITIITKTENLKIKDKIS